MFRSQNTRLKFYHLASQNTWLSHTTPIHLKHSFCEINLMDFTKSSIILKLNLPYSVGRNITCMHNHITKHITELHHIPSHPMFMSQDIHFLLTVHSEHTVVIMLWHIKRLNIYPCMYLNILKSWYNRKYEVTKGGVLCYKVSKGIGISMLKQKRKHQIKHRFYFL